MFNTNNKGIRNRSFVYLRTQLLQSLFIIILLYLLEIFFIRYFCSNFVLHHKVIIIVELKFEI